MNKQLKQILKLSVPERILLVEAIWDSIESSNYSVKLTKEQENILKDRLEDYKKNPDEGSSWEEVKKRIRKKK